MNAAAEPADADGPPRADGAVRLTPTTAPQLTPEQAAALVDLDGLGSDMDPPDPRSPRTMTDDANALRLVDGHGDTIRRVADMAAWWCWTGTVWRRDHDSAHIREHARALARTLPETSTRTLSFKRNSLSSTGISGCVRVAESDPRISVRAADLDAHPLLLNTPGGVVDLRTGSIQPPDPGLLLTRLTATGIDLDAGASAHPRWTAFLAETFADDSDLIGYVQRLAGLALIGEVREHVLPFLYGTGANGKSVLLLVLQGLLGSADTGGYATSAPDGFLMAGRDTAHPTEIARLRGTRLLICSEQTSGRRFDEAKVKRLTGGDVLTGRFMRGDFFDFTPSHLTVIASNHLPQVREGGPSFWRRVRLIPFTTVVPEHRRDPDLAARILATEGPAVLGWAVHGAIAVLEHGLADPARVRAATEDYRISEDTIASFVRDACLVGAGHWCDVPTFRARYERHAADMGAEPLSAKALTLRLVAEYAVEQGRLSRPSRRIYRGIGLLADDPDTDPGDRPQARETPPRAQPATDDRT